MKQLVILALGFLPFNVRAAGPLILSSVKEVTSLDQRNDSSHEGQPTRARVLIKDEAGQQTIVFEKFVVGDSSSKDKLLFQTELAIASLPKVKGSEQNDCCQVTDLKWSPAGINFAVKTAKKAIKCKTSEFVETKFRVDCGS